MQVPFKKTCVKLWKTAVAKKQICVNKSFKVYKIVWVAKL